MVVEFFLKPAPAVRRPAAGGRPQPVAEVSTGEPLLAANAASPVARPQADVCLASPMDVDVASAASGLVGKPVPARSEGGAGGAGANLFASGQLAAPSEQGPSEQERKRAEDLLRRWRHIDLGSKKT